MENKKMYNVIIVGGGPIGIACALSCKKQDISYLVIEKGCLVNSIYNYPQHMTFFSTANKLEIGNIPFVCVNPKPNRNEALEYYRRVSTAASLDVHLFEEVMHIEKSSKGGSAIIYEVQTNKANYFAENIIIATGFHDIPYLLNVPGEQLPKVTHYYKDPHFYAFQNVAIIGANNSAVDAALETWRKGANVTMIIQNEEIGQRVKYWARPDIMNRIEEGSIKAYYNASVISITENNIIINTPNGMVEIQNDWVIAATGYQLNLSFLEKIGIELSDDEIKKPTYNAETHETNVQGIYLAGVICGGMNTHSLFIENSIVHADYIVNDIAHKLKKSK
jgi:thioredoxin reductase (NADPH)